MFRHFLHAGIFLTTLVACVCATVAISHRPIERDLTQRTQTALDEIGGFQGRVTFTALDGLIQGRVQTEAQRSAITAKIADIYGARAIETDLSIVPLDAPWILVKKDDAGEISASGLLATTAEKNALTAALGELAENTITVEKNVAPAKWLKTLSTTATQLIPSARNASIELRSNTLQLSGEMPNARAREDFLAKVETSLSNSGISLAPDLTLAPPTQPSSIVINPPADGQLIVSGRLANLDAAEKLLNTLRSSGDWIVQDEIVIDDNTSPAPWVENLSFLIPSLLSEVYAPGIKIEGKVLRLDGQISEEMAGAIDAVAEQNFPPPDYEIDNHIRILAPPREAMVSVLTYPEGRVILKGLLAEESLKKQITNAVKSAMSSGGELLTDELQVDPSAMEAIWVDSLVQLIPPYIKQVQRGGLTIYSNILAVEAVIDSDADRDSIWAMTEEYFPDDKYRRLLELRFPEEVEDGIASENVQPDGE